MKIASLLITGIYGLFWLGFGLNGFLHFFAIPEPARPGAEFMLALENTGYAMPFVYGTQIVTGLMLLSRRFVPLALLLLAPIVANILFYDVFLNPGGLAIGGVIGVFYTFLLYQNKQPFMSFLKP